MSIVVDAPLDGGDDSVRQSHAEGLAQRVADGGHPVAYQKAAAVAEAGGRQSAGLDLQHGHIADGVRAHQLRLVNAVVIKSDSGPVAVLDHMGVGQDQSILRQHHAGSPAVTGLAVHIAGDGNDGGRTILIKRLQAQLIFRRALQLQREVDGQLCPGDVDLRHIGLHRLIVGVEEILPVFGHIVALAHGGERRGTGLLALRFPEGNGCADQEQQGKAYRADHPDSDFFLFLCRLGTGLFLHRSQGGVPALVVIPIIIAHILSSCSFYFSARGRVNTNSVMPSSLFTAISSSWLLIMDFTRYRPRPTPSLSRLRERSDL